jgi:hypothetical protein
MPEKDLEQEWQAIIKEAENLVNSVLSQLSRNQLEDFNVYLVRIDDVYRNMEHARNNIDINAPRGEYRKIEREEFTSKDWWEPIQPLFDQEDGQVMSNLVFGILKGKIHEIAKRDLGFY